MEVFILSENKKILGSGRRKSSVAQVKLVPGVGNITINTQTASQYLQKDALSLHLIEEPLKTVSLEDRCDLIVKVSGGGLRGQAKAIQLGISRALILYEPSYRASLKQKGLLTRDSRVKERRKYGLKKARKAPQFSKR
uniref:ribosomal protein S9 n=1 Tax=Kalinella pachyderma TaxID=2704665 RepID=UPI0024116411|nr:ribosomal protein S9 [Kalinella pachyderma]WDY12890.1 ribosomal protein S9 [Kalinella pachyderma]